MPRSPSTAWCLSRGRPPTSRPPTPARAGRATATAITDTRASMNIAVHAGNDPVGQVDGSSAGLLRDMIYHGASTTIGAGLVLTLSNLTPGATYSFRLYYRAWGTAAPNRTITVQGDGGHNGVFSDTLDVAVDAGGAHYLDYTYTCRRHRHEDAVPHHRQQQRRPPLRHHQRAAARDPTAPVLPVRPTRPPTSTATRRWPGQPGETAATHDVYFGTSSADVEAPRADAAGVLASAGQRRDRASIPAGWNSARPITGASMRSTRLPTTRSSRAASGASPSSRSPTRSPGPTSRPPHPA